jgi:hypothetical protein
MTKKNIPPDTLENALDSSLANSSWLTPADNVTVAWARYLARKLDGTFDIQEVAKLGKLFETVTRDLGLSIAGRAAKPDEPTKEVSPLDQIRFQIVGRESNAESPNTTSTVVRKPRPRSNGTSRSVGDTAPRMAKKRSNGNSKN